MTPPFVPYTWKRKILRNEVLHYDAILAVKKVTNNNYKALMGGK
jgi:hypothetical protein